MRAYDGIKAERGREVTLETPDFLEQARHLLSKNLTVVLRMSGSSMRPAIEDGDIITVEALADEPVRQGDIVLYQSRSDTAVIHRVVRVERASPDRMVVTRGDGASQNDSPVSIQRVLGKVKHVERAGERIKIVRPRPTALATIRAWLQRLKFW